MNRRFVVSGLALAGILPVTLAQAQTQSAIMSAAAPGDLSEVKTAAQYYAGVIGRAEMSLATSAIAVEMASNRNALEFAGFELAEAIGVNMVLKDMGTTAPKMDQAQMAVLEKMKSASKGASFDRAYISFQLMNHEHLRDLAGAYLSHSAGASDPAERHGRHLATLMSGAFKEHVAICKRVGSELGA